MRNGFTTTPLLLLVCSYAICQEVPNFAGGAMSPNTGAASKLGNTQVNYFTGLPSISVPIYSYSNANTALNIDVSINYFPGGVRVGEPASTVGLGWSLNAGGSITRTVRGMPDDIPVKGFMYSATVATDFRPNASKYYHDSVDAQPDVFSFNCPGASGKFYLGKNGQIAVVPKSKIKIIPILNSDNIIGSFRIITEDGTKYEFAEGEGTNIGLGDASGFAPMPCGYFGVMYASAWHLTKIISAFNTDTISFNYTGRSIYSGFKFPQILYLNGSGGTYKPAVPPGASYQSAVKIESIDLPDKTQIKFVYSHEMKYTDDDYALSKIEISDTVFRRGFLFEYEDSYKVPTDFWPFKLIKYDTRLFLKKITPYTATQKQESYIFDYHSPRFLPLNGDSILNKRDHWGFYNNASNGDNLIPSVAGYTNGANRSPNLQATMASTLHSVKLPGGGVTQYGYELNDRYPYARDSIQFQIQPATGSQTNVTLNQVFNSRHVVSFVLDKSVSRSGSSPISGPGNLNCYIKSPDGLTTYATTTVSLQDLFFSGLKKWSLNLSNGTYRLETQLASGTSISGSFPLNVSWENKTTSGSVNAVPSGGLRVASIARFGDGDDIPLILQTIKYVLEDGKSSGFLGEVPRYDYPFTETIYNGGTSYNNLTAISSEPLGNMDYAQGGIVGYGRVEVYTGCMYVDRTLGKTVYEFTDLKDVDVDAHTPTFPYAPVDFKSWGTGLPKRMSVYDSTGVLVKRTVNSYSFDTAIYNTADFRCLKLGHSGTIYYGDRNNVNTPRAKVFIGEEYYPTGGRAFLVNTKDTLYQANGSVNATQKWFEYDANYNTKKVTSQYDKSRGLQLEQRFYYPYNYTVGGAVGRLRDSGILSTVLATENWIVGDANPRLISAGVTTQKQLANGAVKPDVVYAVETNKPLVQSVIGSFDPSALNRNTNYFKPQTEIVSYDGKGNPLETKAVQANQSSSVIMDYSSQYAVAKVTNAAQADIAYTGFEADGSGNWTIGSAIRDATQSLTGKRSYNLSNGNVSKSSLSSSKVYLFSVWVKSGASVSVNGTSVSGPLATQNGWSLYQVSLSNISSVTVSGSGLIDELRLHPKEANMESTTYEPTVGATSANDLNNTITYKEYDALNRLKIIRDKDKNIVKRFDYSDTLMTISLLPVWEGFDKECASADRPGQVDTLYRDINPFSDSSGYVKKEFLRLDCSCPTAVNNPQFKIINGQCEQGAWVATSSVRVKVNYVWMWRCTYKYCFSDGSQSTYYQEIVEYDPCNLSCYSAE